MAKCKGCGSEIRWIETRSGKLTPIDVDKKSVYIEIKVPDGFPKNIMQVEPGWELWQGHESHFATCPKADQFRNKK